jgi:uncharacterized protein YjdB
MKIQLFTSIGIALLIVACEKISPPPPIVTVDERIEIAPANQGVQKGASINFTAKFFDATGKEATPQPTFTWSSADITIATVNTNGVVTGLKAGQVAIKATYQSVEATALLTVVENTAQVASVVITPAPHFLILNQNDQMTAEAKDINGQTINGETFVWNSENPDIVTVSNTGAVMAKAYGKATIRATTAGGIQSAPVSVFVIRRGEFAGRNGYNVAGTAKLKLDGNLKLEFGTNFSSSAGPDLRVYLSTSNSSTSGALEVALLQSTSGEQTYNIPAGVNITQYRYVLVWCKLVNRAFGVADFGQ